ncbi:MAG: DsbA family protein [Acetobacterales bacterium]
MHLVLFTALAMLAWPGTSAHADAGFTPEQENRIKELVRSYLLEHPQILEEAFTRLQQTRQEEARQQAQAALQQNQEQLYRDPTSPVLGNPKGDVTVVEFFDYRCGYCKRAFPRVGQLLEEDGNIRLVLKELPILGPASVYASRAALAAREQKLYEPFHDALMGWRGDLTREDVLQVAREVGLDVERLQRDMADPGVSEAIERNMALAEALGINGTPAFVIGDTLVPGAVEVDALRELVKRARAS